MQRLPFQFSIRSTHAQIGIVEETLGAMLSVLINSASTMIPGGYRSTDASSVLSRPTKIT
jgi:hypothetical protein